MSMIKVEESAVFDECTLSILQMADILTISSVAFPWCVHRGWGREGRRKGEGE